MQKANEGHTGNHYDSFDMSAYPPAPEGTAWVVYWVGHPYERKWDGRVFGHEPLTRYYATWQEASAQLAKLRKNFPRAHLCGHKSENGKPIKLCDPRKNTKGTVPLVGEMNAGTGKVTFYTLGNKRPA